MRKRRAVSNAWARAEPSPIGGAARPRGRSGGAQGRTAAAVAAEGLGRGGRCVPSRPPRVGRGAGPNSPRFPHTPRSEPCQSRSHNPPRQAVPGQPRPTMPRAGRAPAAWMAPGRAWGLAASDTGHSVPAPGWEEGAQGHPPGAGRWACGPVPPEGRSSEMGGGGSPPNREVSTRPPCLIVRKMQGRILFHLIKGQN